MHLYVILEVELFNVWGLDFMGPFPSSLETAKSWLVLIMSLNGLKLLPHLPMMQRWF